jgi:hypothetical protein
MITKKKIFMNSSLEKASEEILEETSPQLYLIKDKNTEKEKITVPNIIKKIRDTIENNNDIQNILKESFKKPLSEILDRIEDTNTKIYFTLYYAHNISKDKINAKLEKKEYYEQFVLPSLHLRSYEQQNIFFVILFDLLSCAKNYNDLYFLFHLKEKNIQKIFNHPLHEEFTQQFLLELLQKSFPISDFFLYYNNIEKYLPEKKQEYINLLSSADAEDILFLFEKKKLLSFSKENDAFLTEKMTQRLESCPPLSIIKGLIGHIFSESVYHLVCTILSQKEMYTHIFLPLFYISQKKENLEDIFQNIAETLYLKIPPSASVKAEREKLFSNTIKTPFFLIDKQKYVFSKEDMKTFTHFFQKMQKFHFIHMSFFEKIIFYIEEFFKTFFGESE